MMTTYAIFDDDFANVCVLFNIWSMKGLSIGFTTIHSQISSSTDDVYLKISKHKHSSTYVLFLSENICRG